MKLLRSEYTNATGGDGDKRMHCVQPQALTLEKVAHGAEAEFTVDMNRDGDRRWHITSSKGYSECHSRQLVMASEEGDAHLIKLDPIGSHQIGLDEAIHTAVLLMCYRKRLGDRRWPSLSLSLSCRSVISTWTDYSCFPGWGISCIRCWDIIMSAIVFISIWIQLTLCVSSTSCRRYSSCMEDARSRR